MPNSLFLSRRAEKFLGQLTDAGLCRRLRSAIDALANDAGPAGCLKLAGKGERFTVADLRKVAVRKLGRDRD